MVFHRSRRRSKTAIRQTDNPLSCAGNHEIENPTSDHDRQGLFQLDAAKEEGSAPTIFPRTLRGQLLPARNHEWRYRRQGKSAVKQVVAGAAGRGNGPMAETKVKPRAGVERL